MTSLFICRYSYIVMTIVIYLQIKILFVILLQPTTISFYSVILYTCCSAASTINFLRINLRLHPFLHSSNVMAFFADLCYFCSLKIIKSFYESQSFEILIFCFLEFISKKQFDNISCIEGL